MPIGESLNCRHVGDVARVMHWKDGLGPGRDRRFDLVGIDDEAVFIVDQNRPGAGRDDGADSGDERVGGRNDLVTGADPQQFHRQD